MIVEGTRLAKVNTIWPGAAFVYDTSGNFLFDLTAPDAGNGDYFGSTVACSDTHIAVSAPYDDEGGSNTGSVYLFQIDGTFVARIGLSTPGSSDQLGEEAMAMDENKLVVGVPRLNNFVGSAVVFDMTGTELFTLTMPDSTAQSYFGKGLAIADGYILVGARIQSGSGVAYLFTDTGAFVRKFVPHDPVLNLFYGTSVAISGDKVVIGALGYVLNKGKTYFYLLDGTFVADVDGFVNGRQFGQAIAVSDTLDLVVISAFLENAVYFYQTDGTYIGDSRLTTTADYGFSVAICEATSTVVIGAPLDATFESQGGVTYLV